MAPQQIARASPVSTHVVPPRTSMETAGPVPPSAVPPSDASSVSPESPAMTGAEQPNASERKVIALAHLTGAA
jgi:hypothetical protein